MQFTSFKNKEYLSQSFAQTNEFVAPSSPEYNLAYYLKGALAGGICCSITHDALAPVDVVKTRMQLQPDVYKGMVSGFSQVIKAEGAGALLTGIGPTIVGYFIQGASRAGPCLSACPHLVRLQAAAMVSRARRPVDWPALMGLPAHRLVQVRWC